MRHPLPVFPVRHLGALALLAGVLIAPVHAAPPTASPASGATPTREQLAALCDGCAIVASTAVETRKGKPTAAGTAGGAVVGGIIGHKAGDGSVLATGAGAVAGGLIGREIEKHAKKHKVWITTVTGRDGRTQRFEADHDPHWSPGEVVRIQNGALVRVSTATPASGALRT